MTNLFPCAEWAEKLAFKPADLPPEERAALQAHVATCPGCAATYADYQMLMARLRALPRPAARALPPLASEMVTAHDGQEEADGRYDGAGGNVQPLLGAPPPIPLPPAGRRSWPQRLSAIAAALLVAVLVGSLVMVLLTNHRQPGTVTFKLRPGWTVIAEYSGVGSKTISGLDIPIPYLWGSSFACIGSGWAGSATTGPLYSGGFGGGNCTSDPATILSPQDITLFQNPIRNMDKVDTIKVTANSATHWYVQVVEAMPQPTRLGPAWFYGDIGIGGVGGDSATAGPGLDPIGQQAKTWGAVFACIGTGKGSIQFTPDSGKVNIPPCDGQAKLITVHYASPTNVQTMTVTTTGDMIWSAQPVGCANEQKCGN